MTGLLYFGARAKQLSTLAVLAALAGGCRGGVGTTCRCAADCRAGLICSAEGEKALTAELCYKPGVVGLCTESDDVDDSGAPVELTEAPVYLDMPSKRDFQPGISDSVTGTGTDATGTDATSTGTTDATSTGTTDVTGTTDATTSTGTTDATTSTGTGTSTSTGDTSTGSTGSSSSGSSSGSSSSGSSSGSSSSTT